jgi:D-aminoacyl-tRNA deacylase
VRLVVQRVLRAAVRVDGETIAEIGAGALVLLGIADGDDGPLADRMADKLVGLRYFADEEGRTNLAIGDVSGSMLIVSQFTLLADVRRGRRPGFTAAASPDRARTLVDRFVSRIRAAGIRVGEGRFGAAMSVELMNDGPFTLIVDSERDL